VIRRYNEEDGTASSKIGSDVKDDPTHRDPTVC
jgi:hypothetical protein